MIKYFAKSLEKTASMQEEFDRLNKQEAFKSFAESIKEEPVEAFSKGFTAGAILPTFLSIANSNILNPKSHAFSNKFKERVYHGSIAFESAGMDKDNAKRMATALDSAVMRSGIRAGTGENLNANFRSGLKSLIGQQLVGSMPLTDKLKEVKLPATNFLGQTEFMPIPEYREKIIKNIPEKTRPDFISQLSNQIMNDEYSSIAKGKMQIISDKDYSDILDIGKRIAEKEDRPFSAAKATTKRLGRFLKRNALIPGIAGLVGGSAAVKALQSRKEKYEKLVRRNNDR